MVLMKEIHCGHCGLPTRHLRSMLERIVGRQSKSCKDSLPINYACPECNHLGLAQIPAAPKVFDMPGRSAHPDDVVEFLVTLGCANTEYKSHVRVLAPMTPGTDETLANSQIGDWIDDGVKCQQGHPHWKPYEIVEIVEVSQP
jgi:hypothetical protein